MSRLVLWLLRLLPVVGTVLALVGVGAFGALPQGWWDVKGFVVNLASGATAACFGVPLAFFVLQRLLLEREEKQRRRSLVDGAGRAVTRLRENLSGHCTFGYHQQEEIEDLEKATAACLAHLRKMKVGVENDPSFLQTTSFRDLGDHAAMQAKIVGGILFLEDPKAPDRSLQIVEFLKDDVNSSLFREGWATFPADSLQQLSEYLRWIDDRSSPAKFEKPPSFDRLAEFALAQWPRLRAESYVGHRTQQMKTTIQETRGAAEEARENLARARVALSSLERLEEQLGALRT